MSPPRKDVADMVAERRGANVLGVLDGGASDEQPAVELVTAEDVLLSEKYSQPRRTYEIGFPDFDRDGDGGLRSRQSSTLAAPTGKGKTGICGTVVHGMAKRKKPILWACTELQLEEQAPRLAAIALRRAGANWTPDDLMRHDLPIPEQAAAVHGLPLYLVRATRRSTDPFALIVAHARAAADKHGEPPFIVVDYLQKLAAFDADKRRLSVSEVSDRLLEIADVLDTHVMGISSVSRAYYNATARKLRKLADEEHPADWLACGKESGDLEYDAANVLFLDVGDDADAVGNFPARLICAKARQGGLVGFYGVRFHGPSGLFLPDTSAAAELKAGDKKAPQSADLDKIKTEIRRLIMKRKKPFTTRNALVDRIEGRKADILAAIDEMFEADPPELEQEAKGKPIRFVPPPVDGEE